VETGEDFFDQIDNFRDLIDDKLRDNNSDNSELFCECNLVSIKDILDFYTASDSKNLDLIQKKLEIGSGCGSCIKDGSLRKLLCSKFQK
jgi:NAD(P)H-nitrite reductase large subunit